jgi:hypothetical protein
MSLKGLMITGAVLLTFLLLSQIRLWVLAGYTASGVLLRAGLGPFALTLFHTSLPKSDKKAQKTARRAEKRAARKGRKKPVKEEETESRGAALDLFWEILDMFLEVGSRFKRKLRIDFIQLHLIWGAADPSDAAIGYGRAQGVLHTILPLLEVNFKVKETAATIDIDYTLEKPTINVKVACSLTLMQAIALGAYAGRKALKGYLRHRRNHKPKKEKAVR